MDQSPVLLAGGSAHKTNHGEVFYATFKAVITSHLVIVFSDLVKTLTSDIIVIKTRSNVIGSLLVGTLDSVGRDLQLRHKYCYLFSFNVTVTSSSNNFSVTTANK